MIQVSVAISVGENGADGSMIHILNAETIPANHADAQGLFLQAEAVIDRLTTGAMVAAKEQARVWATTDSPFGPD